MTEDLIIIPARGGSKGIPGKNKRMFCGRPLVQWCARAALEADAGTVIVSSDDNEILEAAQACGVSHLVLRPPALASDTATSESVIEHVLGALQFSPEYVALVQPTTPGTTARDISDCFELARVHASRHAMTVARTHHHVWSTEGPWTLDSRGERKPRQGSSAQYTETGGVYVGRVSGGGWTRTPETGSPGFVVIPQERALQLDTQSDWDVAEHVLGPILYCSPMPRIDRIVFDFDGVFTDNRVHTDTAGTESITCSKRDSIGIMRARGAGVNMLVLTNEQDPSVTWRCIKLGISVLRLEGDKSFELAEQGDLSHTAYVGNDINDLECMRMCGWSFCPSDAEPAVKSAARTVVRSRGGDGAVRDVIDLVLTARERMAA